MTIARCLTMYVSGPITSCGTIAGNIARFAAVTAALRSTGLDVYNPSKVYVEWWTQEQYMEYYMKSILPHCASMYMMSGWRSSAGACAEHEYALSNGLSIYYE